MLVLDRREARESVEVEELPVSSRSSGVRFGHDLIEALRVRKGGRSWVLAVAHQEYACPADIFQAGGCHGFGSVVVFDEAAGEKEIGTILAR